jgi:membrane associated rhomboid family serine protease
LNKLLGRLERTFGRFAIDNLATYIVGGTALVFLLAFVRPDIVPLLVLDPAVALKQPWRFVTYLFLPDNWSLLWILFTLYWIWLMGTSLENEWGAFKLNLYYLLGALGTTAAAFITGHAQTCFWLNLSLSFAFATVFPNYEILIFFVVPIKMKWLGLLTFAYVAFRFFIGELDTKVAIVVALGNYLVFFSGTLLALARGQQLQMRQASRRASFAPPPNLREEASARKCAICGKTQDEGADIRVCTCEKCGGPRELCLEHAKNH